MFYFVYFNLPMTNKLKALSGFWQAFNDTNKLFNNTFSDLSQFDYATQEICKMSLSKVTQTVFFVCI